VRRTLESILHVLDVDRHKTLGLERYDAEWPVVLSVPLDPASYDAMRFLASLYPARPKDIMRASVLRALDPGAVPLNEPRDGAPPSERTARVELGLTLDESEALGRMAATARVPPEELARWALEDALGPLLQVHRNR
jgi:hypothetical protein